jgi:glycerol-3-phosphate acyltransferase PlsY
MLAIILCVLVCYLIGSVPFGYLLVKYVFTSGEDIRNTGSGGTGATNVTRRAGRLAGVLTYALDFGKGVAAVIVMRAAADDSAYFWIGTGAVAAVLGHAFPIFLGLRGGKGVATSAGVFFVLAPYSVLAALALWAVVVYSTRYVSLGSLVAGGSVPLSTLLFYGLWIPSPHVAAIVTTAVICFGLILFTHRENLGRLIRGNENKIGQGSGALQR